MFRQMRRYKQQVSSEDCVKILQEEKRAALAVAGDDEYPYAVPVDFYYDPQENRIYIHGAKTGYKTDCIRRNPKVCFTVWNQGFKQEGKWEWNATSVVVFGTARLVTDQTIYMNPLRNLAEKYYPTQQEVEDELSSPAASAVCMIVIDIDHMTGKLVNEK